MDYYIFTQSSAASTWVIEHNFNELPVCDVLSSVGGVMQKITPATMVHTNSNTLTLTFSIPITGIARIVGGRTSNPRYTRDASVPPYP